MTDLVDNLLSHCELCCEAGEPGHVVVFKLLDRRMYDFTTTTGTEDHINDGWQEGDVELVASFFLTKRHRLEELLRKTFADQWRRGWFKLEDEQVAALKEAAETWAKEWHRRTSGMEAA